MFVTNISIVEKEVGNWYEALQLTVSAREEGADSNDSGLSVEVTLAPFPKIGRK